MAAILKPEKKADDNWKIFNSADKRIREQLSRKVPSYEEFKASPQSFCKLESTPKNTETSANDYGYSTGIFHVDRSCQRSNNEKNSEDDWMSDSESSSDAPEPKQKKPSVNLSNKRADAESWESLSDASDDDSFDDFIQKLSSEVKKREVPPEKIFCSEYTSLTNYMMSTEAVESRKGTSKVSSLHDHGKNESKKKGLYDSYFDNNLRSTIDHKLPIAQVIDTIQDINKMLKVGRLTPKMERIMEYKQDHPFRDDYEEEKMNCCSQFIYKIDKAIRKFSATQWPN